MDKKVDVQSVIQEQIKQYYLVISQERENRVKTRNWAITIILAYIAVLSSGKLNTSYFSSVTILYCTIFIFWMTEGFHQSWVLVNEERVMLLEKFLSAEVLPLNLPAEFQYICGYTHISKRTKIRTFFKGTFASVPMLFFYISLLAASWLFVELVFPANNLGLMHYLNGSKIK